MNISKLRLYLIFPTNATAFAAIFRAEFRRTELPPREGRKRVCRGGFHIRPAAPPCRMHPRRTHSVGADAHIGPLGTGIKSTIAGRTNRRGAHGASGTGCDLRSTGGRCTRSRRHVGMPPYARSVRRTAMYTGPSRAADSRPYGKTGSVFVGADAHIGPLGTGIKSTFAERTNRRGAHRASETIEHRRKSRPGFGRPYRPPLREDRRRVCRGGLHGRPEHGEYEETENSAGF